MPDPKHSALGRLIANAREAAGYEQQSDLASVLNTTQQTVSRWELGTSRPPRGRIPQVATALHLDERDLAKAAGYEATATTVALVEPFPLSALNETSFERFCHYFLTEIFPGAQVNRLGGRGHEQGGADIEVRFVNGEVLSFQCKKVEQFGPAQFEKAVMKHTRAANRKIVLLSRVASPKVRDRAHNEKEWELWDVEDISLKVRSLPRETQRKLVTLFFPGQHVPLLGEPDSGVWLSLDEFFSPYSDQARIFNHEWDLVGRTNDADAVLSAIESGTNVAVVISGPGGGGKSRLAKHVVSTIQEQHPFLQVFFAAPGNEVSQKHLHDLGDRKKLLIVEDAHDRADLQLFLLYASNAQNNATLLMTCRTYGVETLLAQARASAIDSERTEEIRLKPLKVDEAEQLSRMVIKKKGGDVGWARGIAEITAGSPLATVIGSHLVATNEIKPAFLANEEEFRRQLLARFRDVISGQIAPAGESKEVADFLSLIALLQPVDIDSQQFKAILEKSSDATKASVNRHIKRLMTSGVIIKRRGLYHISPDPLGDFLIEDACLGVNRQSSGFAEFVFENVSGRYLENLLVNVGRMDWRLSDGNKSQSDLLDNIWRCLRVSDQYQDPVLKALERVAFYQPERALDFAEKMYCEGNRSSELTRIVRNAAYNHRVLTRACEFLWEFGKDDQRKLGQHPEHAIRVLAELADFGQHPFEYYQDMVSFGLSLLHDEKSWNSEYSPLDFLQSLLKTEGHATEGDDFKVTFKPYFIRSDIVYPIRRQVTDALVGLLSNERLDVAFKAADCLHQALRYPHGAFGLVATDEHRKSWDGQFVEIIDNLCELVANRSISDVVIFKVAAAVNWHSEYGIGTKESARRLLSMVPDDLQYRVTAALMDGFGHSFSGKKYKERRGLWEIELESVITNLSELPSAEKRFELVAKIIKQLHSLSAEERRTSYVLVGGLTRKDPVFAELIVKEALTFGVTPMTEFLDQALAKLVVSGEAHDWAKRLLDTDDDFIAGAVARAYPRIGGNGLRFNDQDIEVLRRLFSHPRATVVRFAIDALRVVSKQSHGLAMELVRSISDFGDAIVHELFLLFSKDDDLSVETLSEHDIDYLLARIESLPNLSDYWVQEFLAAVSEQFPFKCLEFFMRRVERAVEHEDWKYRPCNVGPYVNVHLRFRQSLEFPDLIRHLINWSRENSGKANFDYFAADLFAAVLCQFDSTAMQYLEKWLSSVSDQRDMKLMASVINEAPRKFAFEHQAFVERLLEKASGFGGDVLRECSSAVYRTTFAGVKSGSPGSPFPEDVAQKDAADKVLAGISRFSPAYQLYQQIRDSAVSDIERALKQREYLIDE